MVLEPIEGKGWKKLMAISIVKIWALYGGGGKTKTIYSDLLSGKKKAAEGGGGE